MKERNAKDDPELKNIIDKIRGTEGTVRHVHQTESRSDWSPNSSLINCPDCGKEISKSADACPHCGRPRDKTTSEKIDAAGKGMQKVGCILTLVITIPILIILAVLFL